MVTNGFNTTQVITALTGRIGWRQPASGTPVIDNTNAASKSGRYFQDFHPLLTVENIIDAIEGGASMNASAVNAFLARMQQSAILRTLNGIFDEPQLIESTLLFDRTLRNDIPTQNFSKFCGYRLYVGQQDVAVQMSRVSFLFSANCTFKLYLYQDAVIAPIKTKEVTVTAYNETYVDLEDWIINYISPSAMGGVYYIGYYQDEIQAQGAVALDEFVSTWNRSLAFGFTAFETPATWTADNPTFYRIAIPYTLRTYGMNVEIQTYKDFTNKVVKNPSMFDEAVGLTLTIEGLGYMTYSTRSNKTQRITQEMGSMIYNEIMNTGDADQLNPYVAGFKQQLTQEIAKVNRNFFNDPRRGKVVTTRPPIYGVR